MLTTGFSAENNMLHKIAMKNYIENVKAQMQLSYINNSNNITFNFYFFMLCHSIFPQFEDLNDNCTCDILSTNFTIPPKFLQYLQFSHCLFFLEMCKYSMIIFFYLCSFYTFFFLLFC